MRRAHVQLGQRLARRAGRGRRAVSCHSGSRAGEADGHHDVDVERRGARRGRTSSLRPRRSAGHRGPTASRSRADDVGEEREALLAGRATRTPSRTWPTWLSPTSSTRGAVAGHAHADLEVVGRAGRRRRPGRPSRAATRSRPAGTGSVHPGGLRRPGAERSAPSRVADRPAAPTTAAPVAATRTAASTLAARPGAHHRPAEPGPAARSLADGALEDLVGQSGQPGGDGRRRSARSTKVPTSSNSCVYPPGSPASATGTCRTRSGRGPAGHPQRQSPGGPVRSGRRQADDRRLRPAKRARQ